MRGKEFINTNTPVHPAEFSGGVSVRHEALFRTVAATCLNACSITYSIESVADSIERITGSVSQERAFIFPAHQPDACQAYRDAEACVEEYADADIALVNYALSFDGAEQLADVVEQRIETTTRGVIDADVRVVMPNRDAQKAYYEAVDKRGCVDTIDQNDSYASYIASRHMDELQHYDKIVGLTKYPNCLQGVAGAALADAYRYADVFDAKETSELVASHEILHLFGLSHSSTLPMPKGDLDWNGYWLYRGANEKDMTVNVNDEFIQSSIFDQYGGVEVMGAPVELRRDSTINAVQQAMLEWPLRQEGVHTSIALHDLARGAARYSSSELDDSLAMYTLEEPIEFSGRDTIVDGMVQKTFTRVGIAPEQVYPKGDNSNIPIAQVNMYLIEQDDTVVTLGTIPFGDIEHWDSSRTLAFGEEKIIIAAKKGTLTIRVDQ